MWFEWMSPWWRDTVDVAVAVATVLATVGSAVAIIVSSVHARRVRRELVAERRRLHDLDVLERMLLTMVERPPHNGSWSLLRVLQRTLSDRVRRLVPLSVRWSHPNINEWAAELSLIEGNTDIDHSSIGWARFDDGRNVYDAIFDELVDATQELVDHPA